jgi:hypothetical protein
VDPRGIHDPDPSTSFEHSNERGLYGYDRESNFHARWRQPNAHGYNNPNGNIYT